MKFAIYIIILFTALSANLFAGQKLTSVKNPDYLNARGVISIDSPELNNAGRFEINISKYDSLSLVVKGPFGIVVVKLFLTNDTAIFYNALQNTAICVNPKTSNMAQFLGLPLTIRELINILTAKPFAPIEKYSLADSSYYFSKLSENSSNRILFLDETPNLQKSIVNIDTSEFFKVEYKKYYEISDSASLPKLISAEIASAKTKLGFEVENWKKYDEPFKKLSFKMPDDVQIMKEN